MSVAAGVAFFAAILEVSAPPPPPIQPPPAANLGIVDDALERESWLFAQSLVDLAEQIAEEYLRPVKSAELLRAGLMNLYASAGLTLPEHVRQRLDSARNSDELRQLVQQARFALGRVESLEGPLAVVAATEGFKELTDPYSGLMSNRNTPMASSEWEFGLGLELAGAKGPKWLAYLTDQSAPGKAATALGEVPCPVTFPWQITRVLPGSPAARSGLRPGDIITALNSTEITPRNSRVLLNSLMSATSLRLKILRPGADEASVVELTREPYQAEAFFGIQRKRDGSWDFWLDRDQRIAYVRVGTVETGADEQFKAILNELLAENAAGLILDLRWCPGGYVAPTVRIAGLLLPEGKLITRISSRHPERITQSEFFSDPGEGRDAMIRLPVVVLIGPETMGGGEMVAAALQDHHRATIVGQRSYGKAIVMTPISTRFPGLAYKISTGYAYRPNGKNRHRFPDSKPTDDWGVRPDPGFTVPLTTDVLAGLKADAERQAIRPAGDRTALAFDDPRADPQKLVALRILREQIQSKLRSLE
jgi:carboxyl-terminal processing protease